MALKVVEIFLAAVIMSVLSQSIIEDPEVNASVWHALCTGELPAPPRTEGFPLEIEIIPDPHTNIYATNQSILVILRSIEPTFNFRAFLISAHLGRSDRNPKGSWAAGAFGKSISCSHPEFIGEDAAAQRILELRNHQELVYTTPSTPGSYVLHLTTAERTYFYWTEQYSPVLNVV